MMTWLALGVRLGGFAFLMPLVLAKFTSAEVSVWLLFSTIAGFQVIADFGFGPTFSREIAYGYAGHSLVKQHAQLSNHSSTTAYAAAGPDWAAIESATTAMAWLYRRIALATLLLLAVFGTWAVKLPIERMTQSQMGWIAWCIVALTTAGTIYGNSYSAFLIGANRIELQKRVEAVVIGISLLSQFLAVLAGLGLLGLVLVAQVGFITQVLVNRALAFRVSHGRFGNTGQSELNYQVMRSMWPAAWRTAIGAIMSIGVSQGMTIAIANMLVAAEAASVQLALRIMQIISQFSQVPFYTMIPELNRLRADGKTEPLAVAAAAAMRKSLWIFMVGALAVDLGIRHLLAMLGSQTHFRGNFFWLALTLAVCAERFGAMHINILLTSNRAIAHVANGVTGLLWVAGMVVLFPRIGPLALPISMFIAYTGFYAWYSAVLSHRSMPGISFWRFAGRVTAFPLILAAFWMTFLLLGWK